MSLLLRQQWGGRAELGELAGRAGEKVKKGKVQGWWRGMRRWGDGEEGEGAGKVKGNEGVEVMLKTEKVQGWGNEGGEERSREGMVSD